MGGANALLSSPAPLVWKGPSHLPLLITPASLLCPLDQCGGGRLRGQGTGLGAQQFPWPEWTRQLPSAPLLLFPESPSCLPLLISPASGHQSCLASTPPPPSDPPRPTGSLGGSSHLLGHQSPPPGAGRHPSCGEKPTLCLPTPPS